MDQQQLLEQANQFYRAGRLPEAEQLCGQILAAESVHAGASRMLGYIRFQQGQNDEALKLLGTALESDPDRAPELVNYAIVLQAAGRLEEALTHFDKAIAIAPDAAVAFNNRGNVLRDMKRPDEALASFDQAIALNARNAAAHNNRGNTLLDMNRPDEALASFDAAIALKPDFAAAFNNRGNALKALARPDDAMASYAKALAINPKYADAFHNRGTVLGEKKFWGEAVASYGQALTINPSHVHALYNRGGALREMKRFGEAVADFERALTLQPNDAQTWCAYGMALWDMSRFLDAHAAFEKTIALDPLNADAFHHRGACLRDMDRLEDAMADFETALRLNPDHRHAFGGVVSAALHLCDWARMKELEPQIPARLTDGKCIIPALALMGYCDDPALQLQASRNYIEERLQERPPIVGHGAPYRHRKIRIAYLSSDFRQHATSVLMAELVEKHDRMRFEIIGISFAPKDTSALGARIAGAFDQFHDVNGRNFRQVAELLRALEVDIAVDLNGHTRDSCPEILSYRPAPVQVNFLGFPGTMGTDYMDYIIADPVVLPFDQQPFFVERIAQLPHCYQPNDTKRAIAPEIPTRAEAGLPDNAFVFACFNGNWKINGAIFDAWMRLLNKVPGSVLWLFDGETKAVPNLRTAATAHGVDPARLVFAPRVPLETHLARHRLADLFLDTPLYNAHTTGSDALWAGLPIVTWRGKTFPARVGASLLHAAGLPELVTESMADYEALALKLAADPSLLQKYRARLVETRGTCALFDTDRFRRDIEAAYTRMWERAEQSLPPESFAVPA